MSAYSYPTVALCLFKIMHKGCATHPATSSTVSLASSLTTSSLSTLQASCGTSGVASSCRRVMMKPTSHSCMVSCCRQPEEGNRSGYQLQLPRYIDIHDINGSKMVCHGSQAISKCAENFYFYSRT